MNKNNETMSQYFNIGSDYLLKNPDSQYKPELVKLIKIDREDFVIPELGD